MRNPIATAALWGCSGMLAGAAAALVALLPFRPQDPVGFEDLGWVLVTMALGAALALLVGGAALYRGLRGLPLRGWTVLAFVALSALLAAFSAGVAALLAPPLARWLVEAVARRQAPASVEWDPVSRG